MTERTPSSWQARMTRRAISPRLAIRIFLNMPRQPLGERHAARNARLPAAGCRGAPERGLFDLGGAHYIMAGGVRHRGGIGWAESFHLGSGRAGWRENRQWS